jgi:hypothetical protein
MTAKTATGLLVLMTALSTATRAFGQDPLTTAKDLYAAASYEEALSALAQVPANAPPEVVNQSQQYRAFALFALGRTAEAEQVAEAIVRANPLARLTSGDESPRIEAMFARVRARVLPVVIRDEYKVARAAIDATDLKAAEPHLQIVSRLIAELRSAGSTDATLADLNLVVDGFLGLTRATARQQASTAPAATQPAAATPPAAAPVANKPVATLASNSTALNSGVLNSSAANSTTAASPAPVTNRPVEQPSTPTPAASRRPAAAPPMIYSNAGPGKVSPPVVVNQMMPALPRTVSEVMRRTARTNLVLELLINERGEVDDAVVKVPVEPVYDLLVARAARGWKYRPATVDGSPVKYRHAVSVAFSER